jgi:hypothetical protein
MMIEAILLSLLVAFVRRGSVRRLGDLDLRHTWLIFLPLVLFVLLYTKRIHGMEFMGALAPYVQAISYLIVLMVCVLNRHLRGMTFIGLGAALNFAVMITNGGKMPVSVAAVNQIHMEKDLRSDMVRHCIMDDKTRLPMLADVIPLRSPAVSPKAAAIMKIVSPSFPGVMSVGDGIISLGLFIVIQFGACPVKKRKAEELADAESSA